MGKRMALSSEGFLAKCKDGRYMVDRPLAFGYLALAGRHLED